MIFSSSHSYLSSIYNCFSARILTCYLLFNSHFYKWGRPSSTTPITGILYVLKFLWCQLPIFLLYPNCQHAFFLRWLAPKLYIVLTSSIKQIDVQKSYSYSWSYFTSSSLSTQGSSYSFSSGAHTSAKFLSTLTFCSFSELLPPQMQPSPL